jgi:nicotinate dehydrogenase subunit B
MSKAPRAGHPTRRAVLFGAAAIVVNFSLLDHAGAQVSAGKTGQPDLPGSLKDAPVLDSWLRIDADGTITVFTGKAELGQGIRTALLQVAAEELCVDPATIVLITADTERTPNEGYTAGSQSMQFSGTAIRQAAAQAREILLTEAARRLGVATDQLSASGGSVRALDGRVLTYGGLVADNMLHVNVDPSAKLRDPASYRVVGKDLPRVDIPGKVTGGVSYIQDIALPGMAHARIVRPPSYAAKLVGGDILSVKTMPGVVAIIRNGNFLAVVAEREFQAVKAMRALAAAARWQESPSLPRQAEVPDALRMLPSQDGVVARTGAPVPPGAGSYRATFTRPYQIHGSIGPSCALALAEGDRLTVWSHTQGVFPDRKAIAEMLKMAKEQVRVIHVEGAGCYGHNGADDAAADAALIARSLPGRAVRVQWMREQEHAWEPYGPTMVTEVSASLDGSGHIADWNYELWSNIHGTRPGPAGALLAARHIEPPFPPEPPKLSITPNGNGDRNAVPLYTIPNMNVVWHFLPDMPIRVSALRALGAYMNVFSIESAVDDLAAAAGIDPVEFRLRHLDDPRARDVVTMAADRFGWSRGPAPDRGRGFAFARYKNHASYLAIAVEVALNRDSGRPRVTRAVAAIDSGQAVNPDGIRNQTEGGIIQSISWTLYEEVTFDETRITSVDWASYPILRFTDLPDSVEVHVIDRPGQPFLGAGEAAQGPTAGAVGNAIAHAIGKRIYDLPLSRERIRAAIGR